MYSFLGAFGEAVPPQYHHLGPFVDEVWQQVAVDLSKNKKGSAYFIHQAGTYQKDEGLVAEPFFSPNVAKYCADGSCGFVSWGQHAHVPTIHQSGLLYYTRYRDCGKGVVEVTWMMHNTAPTATFQGDTLSYLNVPWGGVRTSTLKDVLLAKKDSSGATLQAPLKSFSDNSYIPNLRDLGGYTTFAQDLPKAKDPFQLPCGDGSGKVVDCSAGTPPKLILRSACSESGGHTSGWGKYTVKCSIQSTVNLGAEGWRNSAEQLEFLGGSGGDGKMKITGVLHWSWKGGKIFFWPDGTSADFNSKFKPGDEIKVGWFETSKSYSDNLALTFVHGTDADRQGGLPTRLRFGSTGNPTRDYTVWTINARQSVQPGHSYWNRQYVVSGRFEESRADATPWVSQTAQRLEAPPASAGRTVTLYSADGVTFAASIGGDAPCAGTARCQGRTAPAPGLPPLFAVSCPASDQAYVGTDPYALSPPGPPNRPYACSSGGRPTWQLLGYFEPGACAALQTALFDESVCA